MIRKEFKELIDRVEELSNRKCYEALLKFKPLSPDEVEYVTNNFPGARLQRLYRYVQRKRKREAQKLLKEKPWMGDPSA